MADPIPKGEEITDSILKHIDRRFINSLDLIGKGDCAVTISRVEKLPKIKYQDGKSVNNPKLMYFSHTDKPLVLNATNIRLISMALGTTNVGEWKGRKVNIFAEPGKWFGKQQFAVRFRTEEVK